MANVGPAVDMNGPEAGTVATVGVAKGGAPVLLAANATVSDADSPNFDGGLLNLFVSRSADGDQLLILAETAGPGRISISGDLVSYGGIHFATISRPSTPTPGTLYLGLNVNATPAAVEALLKRVAYQASYAGYGTDDRFFSIDLRDGDGGYSGHTGTIIKMGTVNRAPVVTLSSYETRFIEASNNGPPTPVLVDGSVRWGDPDGETLVSATVQITGGFRPAEDRLEFRNAADYGLVATYDAATGMLQVTAASGTSRAPRWDTALQAVRYTNVADEPTGGTRQITFVVSDGKASSAPVSKAVSIVTTTDPTVLDLNGAASDTMALANYTEQAPPVAFAPDATLIDADTPDFAGGRLRVVSTFGFAQDLLGIRSTGNGPGQISVDGSTVRYGGQAIGTVSGGAGMYNPLMVEFQAGATPVAVQALVRSLTYYNGSDEPWSSASLEVTVTDAAGTVSNVGRVSVQVTRVDDPMTLDLDGTTSGQDATATYEVGRAFTSVAPAALLTDADNENLAGGSLSLRLIGGREGDVLGIMDQGRGAGQIFLDENDAVLFGNMRIGTVYPLQGRVAFNMGSVSEAAVQALVRAIGFTNVTANPGAEPRTVELTLVPKQGAAALVQKVTISIASNPANKVLVGDEGANDLRGGAGNDELRGMGGDDLLVGGGGDDRYDGGVGFDTAAFAVAFGQATLTRGDAVVVRSGEGVDISVNVERFRFADGAFTFDPNSLGAMVQRLYYAVLGREADQQGLEHWLDRMDAGAGIRDVASHFLQSPEFQRSGADVASNGAFADFLYRYVLGREPDAAGRADWVARLDAGLARSDALLFFSESDEHKALARSVTDQGYFETSDTAQTVALLYDTFLDRLPDVGGLMHWMEKLDTGSMTLAQVADLFAASPEFQNKTRGMGDAQLIDYMYGSTLNRTPAQTERDHWAGELGRGLSKNAMLLFFATSPEHERLLAEHITGGVDVLM